jgi:hypothetical protein
LRSEVKRKRETSARWEIKETNHVGKEGRIRRGPEMQKSEREVEAEAESEPETGGEAEAEKETFREKEGWMCLVTKEAYGSTCKSRNNIQQFVCVCVSVYVPVYVSFFCFFFPSLPSHALFFKSISASTVVTACASSQPRA